MRLYWSDRDGNPAPENCTFSCRPFSDRSSTVAVKQVELPPPASVKVLRRTFSPTREQWIENVEKALHLIRRKELQKVVLARTCTLELAIAPDPFTITAALKSKAQGAFLYCLQSDTDAFLGASPERLFSRKNRLLLSEAIAGTRRRGKNPFEDAQLRHQLLTSPKDLNEFFPVCTYLQTTLAPLSLSAPTLTKPTVHQTQNVQHLYSQCSANLKDSIEDEQIIDLLHPTPALCGIPKEKAFQIIRELEPFERGLYGGVIGWSTQDAAEHIVAIRSCHLSGKIATLFSGTGIVEGSNPQEEWEELNQKLRLYDGIFVD